MTINVMAPPQVWKKVNMVVPMLEVHKTVLISRWGRICINISKFVFMLDSFAITLYLIVSFVLFCAVDSQDRVLCYVQFTM
jgi:hypothetical protein